MTPIQTKPQIIENWQLINGKVASFITPLSEATCQLAPANGKWSIAGHLEHLFWSANPISSVLKLPPAMVLSQMGKYEGSPRDYATLRDIYKAKLVTSNPVNNPFGPKGDAKTQAELLQSWNMVGEKISARLAGWTEEDLDQCLIPHPLLGAFSMREMLFFTIFHTEHHLNTMEEMYQS